MLTRSIFRALCAMLIGFLLVSNPTEMTVLLVQIIGGLFIISGIIAVIGYFINSSRVRKAEHRAQALADNPAGDGAATDTVIIPSRMTPIFPFAGIGSVAFGVFLLCFPAQFVNYLMYVLGALLILVGITQIITLVRLRDLAPISWSLFILPLLVTAAGIFIILKPLEAAALPFTILGIAYIIYGVTEFLFGIRFYRFRRRLEAEMSAAETAEAPREAEAEEITDIEPTN
ncbi:MAG: DUF308 domain-containing protein [Bacteroidaceae bacterium]|nr:DUF308 domain-containing protein [Bacteroidaceae bacterium]MBR0434222.1 DUF308 domain-containing protein [Bacteroidaceae bacterium]